MLKPLTQFICDTCGEIIEEPNQGWIEWISHFNEENNRHEVHSFKIVHHTEYSPFKGVKREGCYQLSNQRGVHDTHLNNFISEEYKMANILKFLDIGPYHEPIFKGTNLIDLRQYVDTVRRLTIPHYEEARLYWNEALDDGFFNDCNELWIYGVENLKYLIEKYSNE